MTEKLTEADLQNEAMVRGMTCGMTRYLVTTVLHCLVITSCYLAIGLGELATTPVCRCATRSVTCSSWAR